MSEQSGNANSSLHNSLRDMLVYFYDNAKEEELKKAIKQAQVLLYKSNKIDDSLAVMLLKVEVLLLKTSKIERQTLLSYAEALVQSFQPLPPQKEHPHYTS